MPSTRRVGALPIRSALKVLAKALETATLPDAIHVHCYQKHHVKSRTESWIVRCWWERWRTPIWGSLLVCWTNCGDQASIIRLVTYIHTGRQPVNLTWRGAAELVLAATLNSGLLSRPVRRHLMFT